MDFHTVRVAIDKLYCQQTGELYSPPTSGFQRLLGLWRQPSGVFIPPDEAIPEMTTSPSQQVLALLRESQCAEIVQPPKELHTLAYTTVDTPVGLQALASIPEFDRHKDIGQWEHQAYDASYSSLYEYITLNIPSGCTYRVLHQWIKTLLDDAEKVSGKRQRGLLRLAGILASAFERMTPSDFLLIYHT